MGWVLFTTSKYSLSIFRYDPIRVLATTDPEGVVTLALPWSQRRPDDELAS